MTSSRFKKEQSYSGSAQTREDSEPGAIGVRKEWGVASGGEGDKVDNQKAGGLIQQAYTSM